METVKGFVMTGSIIHNFIGCASGIDLNWKLFRKAACKMSVSKVAIIVPNPCNPDYRVVKQAETLAKAGYEVRIFCTNTPKGELPDWEEINGVGYVRRPWTAFGALKSALLGLIPFRSGIRCL